MTNSTSLPFNYGGRHHDLEDVRDDHDRTNDHYRYAMDEIHKDRMRTRGGDNMLRGYDMRKTHKRRKHGGRTHKRRHDKIGGRRMRRDKRMRTYRR
jgi:hypothetical protein